jgi:hypothetical protein
MRTYALTYIITVDVEDDETPEAAGQMYLQQEGRHMEPSTVEDITLPTDVPGWVLPDPDSQAEYRRKYLDDSGYWLVVGPDGTMLEGPFAYEQQAEETAEAMIADGDLTEGSVSVAYVSTP